MKGLKLMSKNKDAEMVVYDEGKFAVSTMGQDDLKAMIRENTGGGELTRFDLPNVKVPGSGGTMWAVPTLEGDEENLKEISGIIVSMQTNRAYWAMGFDESGGGTPPDCSSIDGFTGKGVIVTGDEPGTHDCGTCPHNQFGTAAKGGGKACKEMRVMYMLRPGDLLPMCIGAPPGSLKNMKNYGLALASKAKLMRHVVTGLSLEKKNNKQGIAFAAIKARVLRELTDEEAKGVDRYADVFKPVNTVSVDPKDYEDTTEL